MEDDDKNYLGNFTNDGRSLNVLSPLLYFRVFPEPVQCQVVQVPDDPLQRKQGHGGEAHML